MNFPQAADSEGYLALIPEERRTAVETLLGVFRDQLPPGFQETIQYGMISFVVPLSLYPAGYHCQKDTPLPFIAIASQKAHLAVYHMGLYASAGLLESFQAALAAEGCRAGIGKSCIRLSPTKPLPLQALGALARALSPAQWIGLYEQAFAPGRTARPRKAGP